MSLTNEQKQMIAEKRQKAIAIRQAKMMERGEDMHTERKVILPLTAEQRQIIQEKKEKAVALRKAKIMERQLQCVKKVRYTYSSQNDPKFFLYIGGPFLG